MEDFKVKLKQVIENNQILDCTTFKQFFDYICKSIPSHELLDLIFIYLEPMPHQISLIPKGFVIHLLLNTKRPLHPIVLYLASRHDDIDYNLPLDNLPIEEWAYLLSAIYQRIPMMICDPELVLNVKNNLDTYKMLIDSPQWFNENGDFFMALHSIDFDEDECDELFTRLKNNWSIFKVTKAAVSFVDLVASKCNKEVEFMEFLITVLFSFTPENKDVTWLSDQIINNLKLLETVGQIQISDWDALTIKAVKYGLMEENPEYSFIKVFRKLIKKSYVDKLIVSKSFELLAGHSQFSNIMLNRDANQLQKEEVLRLVETLVKKEPSLMALSHVPLFLCSYNASLSVTDQILLRILFHYEENSIPMSNYRPYLWGSFAVSHYQVKSHLVSKTLNNFPSTTEVISYIPLKRLKETISCFPVQRILNIKNQKIVRYKPSEFKDPHKMFDPAFFLPMISSLLATEAPLSIEKFNRNGCLSMVLACFGSCDSSMRSAAYHVLTLLRSHLFCRRAENMFWDHFITWVGHGIQDLRLKPPPQLSMIQALFLSRMVLAIANHEKGVETSCCKILLARPCAQLNHIPELKLFLTKMTSVSRLNDKTLHMRWFFEIIRDGIRSENDWPVLKKMDLLNVFLILFRCSNTKYRILILKIMEAIFRIQPATSGGTGPWALSLMVQISKYPDELSTEEIIAVFRCLQSLSNSTFISIPAIDFWLSFFMEHGNTDSNICLEGFVTLNVLFSKFQSKLRYLNENKLRDIVRIANQAGVLTADEVLECEYCLQFGTKGIKIKETNSYRFLPILVKILNLER